MNENKIELDNLSLTFEISNGARELRLPKSLTRINTIENVHLLTEAPKETFIPLEVKDEGDAFRFLFSIDDHKKKWEDLNDLSFHEKIRLLLNLTRLKKFIDSRITFFIHTDNVVFDDNLQPHVIYRGIQDLIPPYTMEQDNFLKQLKCFSIALLSDKYTFDQLYNGSLENAKDTEVERQIQQKEDIAQFTEYLQSLYITEKQKAEETMKIVSKKRFSIYKNLMIAFGILIVILAVPLAYIGIIRLPYQQSIQKAHEAYLAKDYEEVITTLNNKDASNLPNGARYILASAYLSTEQLSEDAKAVIMNNVNLNSNKDYLLYWIFNGRGNFDAAMEKAKYLDDPQLIMYGLIKQKEQAKNDPELSGSARDKTLKELQEELDTYREQYNLDQEENQSELETSQNNQENLSNNEKNVEESASNTTDSSDNEDQGNKEN
ncbi:type VII secretion protein EssB [Paraliobacillus ryukyuensis]|uniref:type VII secretion protein EssB n=1 Tax=Paraliobacillus ryukyuensis TaxID=200904 RepID=UPI0009A6490E|nr:type VII secretion protein EssB [Paraliobacillus ryukyuensis]